jgi:hypothetical protein
MRGQKAHLAVLLCTSKTQNLGAPAGGGMGFPMQAGYGAGMMVSVENCYLYGSSSTGQTFDSLLLLLLLLLRLLLLLLLLDHTQNPVAPKSSIPGIGEAFTVKKEEKDSFNFVQDAMKNA